MLLVKKWFIYVLKDSLSINVVMIDLDILLIGLYTWCYNLIEIEIFLIWLPFLVCFITSYVFCILKSAIN